MQFISQRVWYEIKYINFVLIIMQPNQIKNAGLASSQKIGLKKVKSQGKQGFSMNLGHVQKKEDYNVRPLKIDTISKVDVNKIQSKIGKCIQRHKNKIQKTKQLIRLERYNPTSSVNTSKNSSESQYKSSQDLSVEISYRQKDCYVLERGRMKPMRTSPSSPNLSTKNLKKQTPKNEQIEKQQTPNKKKLPEGWHPRLLTLQNFSSSISTNSSRGSINDPKLQDFEIDRQLGEGKYGKVFLAKHKKTGMLVALKKMEKSSIDFYAQKQIIQEIKIQFFIRHPNVIKLYTFFSQGDNLYLVIELFVSGHLFSFLQKKGRIQQRLTKSIVKQICEGLKHLHLNNIIHRDIKLQNILYQMGMIKICDFGWSIQTEDFRQTFCGTPLYLSPQILQQKGYDNKIDVWSVGILTFQLLYGRVPFEITSQLDFVKIVYEQVKFPENVQVSNMAKNFILKCLIKDPALRFTVAQLLQHPFLKQIEEYQGAEMF